MHRMLPPIPAGLLCLFFLMALIWQLGAAALSQAQPQRDLGAKNVLVLYSEDKAHPAHELTDQGIRSAFRSNTLFDVQVYDEYLDASRFGGLSHARVIADYLRRKYSGMKIDAIIAIYPYAVDLLLAERRTLFPELPIIATEITRSYAENLERSPARRFVTGIIMGDNITGVMDAALRVRPETKRVALVAGTSPTDAHTEEIFRRGFRPYAGKIDLIDLTKLSMGETLSRVGSLPPDTLVFYASIFRDGARKTFVPREALALISRAANAPVFSFYDTYLGYGIVGGRLVSLEQQGKEAAKLALRIMGGESPASIPFGGEQAYIDLYDWRELKRWNLSERTLPKGAIVINREFTLWDFRYYIIGAVAFCLGETALIIFLIVQRRRKRVAEEALRQKTEELDQFFNISPDLLRIANTDGYFQRLNPAWERILGYTREELMARRFFDLLHPDDLNRTREVVSTMESQQNVLSYENRYRCKDGTYRWLEWSSAPVGKLIYAVARDTTERKRAEEALQNSEEKFRQFFKNILDYCYIISTEGNILHVNEAALKTLGYKREELVGQPLARIYAPESLAKLEDLFTQWKESGQIRDEEMVIVTRKGERRVVILNVGSVKDKDGTLLHSTSVQTDITERKRAEEELRKYQEHLEERIRERTAELEMAMNLAEAANQAKSTFLANMSHELRTPLNSILGIAQLMERNPEFPQKDKEFLKILSSSGRHLFELIDEVLEMSKIEAGRTTLVRTAFDLHRFLEELIGMMRPRAEKKNLELVLERDPLLPKYIQTDGRKLHQILSNLLGNAIKFTDTGRVTLRIKLNEGLSAASGVQAGSPARLAFEVEDTGLGIAHEDRERIFEPFVQLSPVNKPSGGTGLGLAISRRLAALLGGEITVRSQVGRGSTFKLEIEVQPAEDTDIPARAVARRVVGLAPGQADYRLLVVDDSYESRLLFRQLLEPVGFRVLEAAGGQEAVEIYRKDPPQLIWMDIRMPGMNGYEVAGRIREEESGRRSQDGGELHTPIIALTAGVMENRETSPLAGVFDDWVYKPFREEEIFAKIERHLGVRFLYRESALAAGREDSTQDRAAIPAAELVHLPGDWLEEFSRALKTGWSKGLLTMIDRIQPEHAPAARVLGELVRIHQFDKLIALIQEALKEKANG